MAYRCGYVDGYDDTCVNPEGTNCSGGGYAGVQYAAGPYGGMLPCVGFTPTSSTDTQSNVEEFCVLEYMCGIIRSLD